MLAGNKHFRIYPYMTEEEIFVLTDSILYGLNQ